MNHKKSFTKSAVLVLIFLLLVALIPMVSFGEDSGETLQKEYIVTSSMDLSKLQATGHITEVKVADSHMVLIVLDRAENLKTVEKSLAAEYEDVQLQPNYVYEYTSVNDPYYEQQWGLQSSTGVDISFDQAEEFVRAHKEDMKETVVAVIDTGFDYSHSDLSDNIWINEDEIPGNGKDDDHNGYVDDTYGYDFTSTDGDITLQIASSEYEHGTHCAGIIGAVSNNHIGITGVAGITGKLQMMNLKVLSGREGTGSSFDLIRAIKYAEANGADICNISMGSYANDSALYTTIAKSNMLFVCAAGNEGQNLNVRPMYPGSYNLSNVICVTNLQADGAMYRGANYGNRVVELAAPGTNIYSTVPGDKYKTMSGTSMSAPFVTGVCALVHSYYTGISAADIKEVVMATVTEDQLLTNVTISGGYVNAYKALSQYGIDDFKPDETAPVITATALDIEGSYKQRLVITATDDSGEQPEVRYVRGSKTKAYFRNGSGYEVALDEDSTGSKKMGVPGTYTVYAVDASGNDTIYKVECTADAISSVKLNYTKKTLSKGKSFRIKATFSKEGTYGRTLTYTSSDTSIATVSATGKVTAKKKGTTTITVKTGNLLTAKCKIVVQ